MLISINLGEMNTLHYLHHYLHLCKITAYGTDIHKEGGFILKVLVLLLIAILHIQVCLFSYLPFNSLLVNLEKIVHKDIFVSIWKVCVF